MGYKITQVPIEKATYGAADSGYAILPVALAAEHMRNGFRLVFKLDQCDVTTQVDFSLQEKLGDTVTSIVKTVSAPDQSTEVSIRMHPGVPADAALFPLLPTILVTVTTQSGDAVEISSCHLIEADE